MFLLSWTEPDGRSIGGGPNQIQIKHKIKIKYPKIMTRQWENIQKLIIHRHYYTVNKNTHNRKYIAY